MRLLWISTIAALLFGAINSHSSVGQDPFGDAPGDKASGIDAMASPSGDGSNKPEVSDLKGDVFERSAVVKSLLARPPKSHADLARAVQLMARVKRWEEVSRWLKAIDKLGIDERSAATMVEQVGGKTFQSLLGTMVQLEETDKAVAKKILDLANQQRINPESLRKHLVNMRSQDQAVRIAGFRGIQAAGYPGIAAMLNELMSADAVQPSPIMCEALGKLHQPAKDAWKVAMRSPHQDARLNLIKLAVGSKDAKYNLDLHSIFSSELDDGDWTSLKNAWVQATGNAIASNAALELSNAKLEAALSEYRKVRWEDDANTGVRWILSEDGRSLSTVECRNAEQRWESVVAAADNVIFSSQPSKRDSALAIAVKLQHHAVYGIHEQHPGSLETLLDRFEYACLVWDAAVSYDLSYAQSVVIPRLGRFVEPMPLPVQDRLVAALNSGYAPVRYAAAVGLMQYIQVEESNGNPQVSFRGRSRFDQVVEEMTKLGFRPRVLLVGGSSSLRSHMRILLEEHSFEVDEHASAASVIPACKKGATIDSIYLVAQVLEMDLAQLAQRIRATPSGATAPISVLADSLSNRELELLQKDPRTVLGSIPPEGEGLVEILRQVRLVQQSPTLEETDQIVWKDLAIQFRNQAAQRLVATQRPTLTPPLADTPLQQKNLILRTLDKELSLPEREQASQIFVQSVRQFGLLMSSESADAQYDVYNDRGQNEPETRVLLGRILDAIEASRGKKDWSSVSP
jgi:CheY-like chemotaxis protein